MIQNLFALPIYKTNIFDSDIDFGVIRSTLEQQYKEIKFHVGLEKNGGISTYGTNRNLHEVPEFKALCDLILYHANLYWKVLDINDGLCPAIDECWSNKHVNGSFTDWHSHSMHPIVVSFYLSAPERSGGIVFTNPMEYSITHIPYNRPVEEKINTTIHIKSGDVLMFPGWLRHKTEVSHTDDERIVITFNLRYSGVYLDSQQPYPVVKETPMPDNFSTPIIVESNNSTMDYLFNKLHTQEIIINQLKAMLTGGADGR